MNPLDNRISNLREAKGRQNLSNAGKREVFNRKKSSSRFKGVYWHKQAQKWCAHVSIKGKITGLGMFINEDDVGKTYDKAAIKSYGEFARTNKQLGLL